MLESVVGKDFLPRGSGKNNALIISAVYMKFLSMPDHKKYY